LLNWQQRADLDIRRRVEAPRIYAHSPRVVDGLLVGDSMGKAGLISTFDGTVPAGPLTIAAGVCSYDCRPVTLAGGRRRALGKSRASRIGTVRVGESQDHHLGTAGNHAKMCLASPDLATIMLSIGCLTCHAETSEGRRGRRIATSKVKMAPACARANEHQHVRNEGAVDPWS
jgi:hypothetical protein